MGSDAAEGLGGRASGQLTRRTAAGAGLLVATRLVTRCIDLATLILLARLLTPADFGLVAIAMTLVVICEAVSDLPIAQAVARLPVLTQDDLDTAFTLSVLRGLGIATVSCLVAWPFATLYQDSRLFGLLCLLGFAPALRGVCNPRFAMLAWKLDFRREMLVEVVAKLVSLLVATMLAWTTRSYWAIAAGTIATPATMNVVAYLIAPWRPRFTLRRWQAFARFLSWSSAGQVLNAISWQVDQLALGRFVPRADLGNFTIASTLAFLPFQAIINQIARPLISGLAMLQDQPARLAAAYRLGAGTLVAFCMPAMVGMSILAHPIVLLVLGPKWDAAAEALGWLALISIPALLVAPAGPLAMAVDRTDLGFRLSGTEFLVRLPLTCVAAATAGIPGVLVARAVATLLTTAYAVTIVKTLTGQSATSQMRIFWRPILGCLVMAVALLPLADLAEGDAATPWFVARLLATCLWGASVYVCTMLALWRAAGRPSGPEERAVAVVRARALGLSRRRGRGIPSA